jgi:putative transposase
MHRIGNIVIGKNKDWKDEVKLGKVNNQNFVSVPFNTFIEQVKYKAEEVGI